MRRLLGGAFVVALFAGHSWAQDGGRPAIQLNPSELRWGAGAPPLPAGTQVAVLEGNPRAAGPFTMRLRIDGPFRLGAHWHPQDERITVLEGSLVVGLSAEPDPKREKRFEAGGFYVTPAGVHHYLYSDGPVTLQLNGVGPWELHLLGRPDAGAAPKAR